MENKKLAVLIDSDNTQYSKLHLIIEELSGFGQIVVKRAYGDFSSEHLKNWKTPLNEMAIQPTHIQLMLPLVFNCYKALYHP
jgi:hypothetical protein